MAEKPPISPRRALLAAALAVFTFVIFTSLNRGAMEHAAKAMLEEIGQPGHYAWIISLDGIVSLILFFFIPYMLDHLITGPRRGMGFLLALLVTILGLVGVYVSLLLKSLTVLYIGYILFYAGVYIGLTAGYSLVGDLFEAPFRPLAAAFVAFFTFLANIIGFFGSGLIFLATKNPVYPILYAMVLAFVSAIITLVALREPKYRKERPVSLLEYLAGYDLLFVTGILGLLFAYTMFSVAASHVADVLAVLTGKEPSIAQMAIIFGLFQVGGMIMALVMSRLFARISPTILAITGLVLFIVGQFAAVPIPTYTMAYLGGFLAGLGWAMYWVTIIVFVAAAVSAREERWFNARYFGLFVMVTSLSYLVSTLMYNGFTALFSGNVFNAYVTTLVVSLVIGAALTWKPFRELLG